MHYKAYSISSRLDNRLMAARHFKWMSENKRSTEMRSSAETDECPVC